MIKVSLIFSLMLFFAFGPTAEAKKNRKEYFYSESIDYFNMLDQISAWSPHHQKIYRQQFEEKFGWNQQDELISQKYILIRKKYLHKIKREEIGNFLFPQSSIDMDLFSRAFYSADTLNEGLLNLQRAIPSKEFRVIKEFFQHFIPKVQPWNLEAKTFTTHLKNYKKQFEKGKGHQIVRKMKTFFNLDKKEMSKIHFAFVWIPEHSRPEVEMMSNVFVVKIHPTTGMAKPDFFHIMSEIVDAMMDAQKEGQKAAFTTQFIKECQVSHLPTHLVFKWPMAVAAGGIWFQSNLLKKEFSLASDWSKNPWVQNYAQQLFPLVERGTKSRDHIMGKFLKQSGLICQNLVNLSGFLQGLQKDNPTD